MVRGRPHLPLGSCQPEITNLDDVADEEDVLGLDVAVLDGGGPPSRGPGTDVEMIEGKRRLAHPVEKLLRRKSDRSGVTGDLKPVVKRAIAEPHRDDELKGRVVG